MRALLLLFLVLFLSTPNVACLFAFVPATTHALDHHHRHLLCPSPFCWFDLPKRSRIPRACVCVCFVVVFVQVTAKQPQSAVSIWAAAHWPDIAVHRELSTHSENPQEHALTLHVHACAHKYVRRGGSTKNGSSATWVGTLN